MWWIVATSLAFGAVPVRLPAGEDAAAWSQALTRSDLAPTADLPVEGARVQVDAEGAGWRITAYDEQGAMRTVRIEVPETPSDRARVAWLCASLAEAPVVVTRPLPEPVVETPRAPRPRPAPSPVVVEVAAPEPVASVDTVYTRPALELGRTTVLDAATFALPTPARERRGLFGVAVGPSIGVTAHTGLAMDAEIGANLELRLAFVTLRGSISGTTGSTNGIHRYNELAYGGGVGISPRKAITPIAAVGAAWVSMRTSIPDESRHTQWEAAPWGLVGMRFDQGRLPPFEIAANTRHTSMGWTTTVGLTTWFDGIR